MKLLRKSLITKFVVKFLKLKCEIIKLLMILNKIFHYKIKMKYSLFLKKRVFK